MRALFTVEVVVSRLACTIRPCDVHLRWIKQKTEPVRDWVSGIIDTLPEYLLNLNNMPVGATKTLRVSGELTGGFDRWGEFTDDLVIHRVKFLRK